MKKLFIFLFLGILLVGTLGFFILKKDTIQEDALKPTYEIVKTAQGTIIKEYFPSERIVTLTDEGTKAKTLSAKLNTAQDYKVGAGYGKVAQFTINSKQDRNNILGQFELYDKKNNDALLSRQIDVKYLTIQQVEENVYDNKCSLSVNETTQTCEQVVVGTRMVEQEAWLPFDNSVKTNEEIVIGLFTDVQVGDKIEWIPTIAGVRVQEWAGWTADLNVDLELYYDFEDADESISHTLNLTANEGAMNYTTNGALIGKSGRFTTNNNLYLANSSQTNIRASEGTHNFWYYADAIDGDVFYNNYADWDFNQQLHTSGYLYSTGFIEGAAQINYGVGATSWTMITYLHNSSGAYIYINGSIAYSGVITTTNLNDFAQKLGVANDDSYDFIGYFDEMGYWSRALTDAEIIQLYNGGIGMTYGIIEVSVELEVPTNNTQTKDDPINFLAQLTPNTYNLTNGTINIWYENGTLFNTSTNSTFSDPSIPQNITFSISNWTIGDYLWNVYGCMGNCNGTNSSWADNNFTFKWIPFNNTGEDFNSLVLETSQQIFRINISTDSDWAVNNGRLIYNGTTYENADKEDLGEGNFQLTQTIYIPAGTTGFSSENRSFNWNITLSEITTGSLFSSTTDENNQTVNELIFYLCSGTAIESVLNFTMIDEETGEEINATANPTTFQATFNLGASYLSLSKNYSINNQSVNTNEFDFCTDNSSNIFYVDLEAFYTATNYVNKNYFLNNASLNGSETEEINLYLLNESNAIEFFIKAEQDLSPITSATINIEKYFVGEGIYKTVEIDETSSDSGEFTAYLDLDKDYKFTISKEGSVLGIITKIASCKQAPCELILSLRSDLADVYSQFSVNFAQNVVYNLSWNPNTKIVTFDFIDTTGLADYFNMKVWQGEYNTSSSLIIDSQLYTSSGTITGNLSNYTFGDFTVNVYVSRSPEIFIDFIKITMKEFVGKFGLLGLFFAFLLALTIIFGLSFNPAILCLSIPLSLTILNLIGILAVSWQGITIVYVLAAIAIGAMIK